MDEMSQYLVKGCKDTFIYFPPFFTKGNNFASFCCFHGQQNLSKIGLALKGKNLLLLEEIISFKN